LVSICFKSIVISKLNSKMSSSFLEHFNLVSWQSAALIVTPLIVPEQTWASSAGYALSELGGNGNGCGRKPCRATVYFKIVGL
jgi:hypothetical protein